MIFLLAVTYSILLRIIFILYVLDVYSGIQFSDHAKALIVNFTSSVA